MAVARPVRPFSGLDRWGRAANRVVAVSSLSPVRHEQGSAHVEPADLGAPQFFAGERNDAITDHQQATLPRLALLRAVGEMNGPSSVNKRVVLDLEVQRVSTSLEDQIDPLIRIPGDAGDAGDEMS